MPGGYWVEESCFLMVWKLFWRNAHLINDKRKHIVSSLCGDPKWESRTRGERIKIGRCFKYFATHNVLPIVLANPGRTGPRKYLIQKDRTR